MPRLKFRTARVAAVLIAAAAAVTLFASPASADPDNLPILHAGSGGFAHQCKDIGDSGIYSAIVCSDIKTGVTSDTSYYSIGQVEAFCEENHSTIVGCYGVETYSALESGAGTVQESEQGCGWNVNVENGVCVGNGQRNYFTVNSYHYSYSNAGSCDTNLSSTNQVYNVAFGLSGGGGTIMTEIWLPNYAEATLSVGNDGANISSGHFFVCP